MHINEAGLMGLLPGLVTARNRLIDEVRSIEAQIGFADSVAQYITRQPEERRMGTAHRVAGREERLQLIEQAAELRTKGYSYREIGEQLGYDTATIGNWLNRRKKEIEAANAAKQQKKTEGTPSQQRKENKTK